MTMPNKKRTVLNFTFCNPLVICIFSPISTAELPIGEELSVGEFSAFGNIYMRETGVPVTETDTFTVPNPNTKWGIRGYNSKYAPKQFVLRSLERPTMKYLKLLAFRNQRFAGGIKLFNEKALMRLELRKEVAAMAASVN